MDFLQKKEFFVPVNSANLFCHTAGETGSPFIVIHGGPGLGQNYLLPQMNAIGQFSYAIFYDQRGTGKSTTENNHWQANPFQTYVNDVNQLREAFRLDKISLLAHSWGSILASLYALAYPQHVDKIIYLNPVPVSSTDYIEFVKHRSEIVDTNKEELNTLRESPAFTQGDPETVEKFYRIYFRNYFDKPELAEKLNLKMSATAAINNFKIYELFFQYTLRNPFDLYAGLNVLKNKTLIVACDKDIIPLHYTERLHQNIPGAEWALIKNSGHFPYIDQPEILFKILREFIEN